jgi:hypothetical protein
MEPMEAEDWLAPLRQRELIPPDSLAAFVVGSSARGWQNARSDFDIYVVTKNEWDSDTSASISMPLNPPRARSETFFQDSRRWEVTYWVDSQFDQMLAKVSWDEYGRNTAPTEVLTPREELVLSRLGNCLPVLGTAWIADCRKRLDASAFRSFVVVRSLGQADDAVEDALGQMESGHLEAATLSARRALGHAIDALLEGQGEYGSHMPKWRANRFKAVAPETLSFEEYWALETMQGYDPADPRPWIKDVLTICQDISMRVETS